MWTLLKKLLPAGSSAVQDTGPDHALIVTTVGVTATLDAVIAVEDALIAAFSRHSAGDVDGHEMAVDGSEALIYTYGRDAAAMFTVALPVLRAHHLTATSRAMLRFGDVSDPRAKVEYRLLNDPQWNP